MRLAERLLAFLPVRKHEFLRPLDIAEAIDSVVQQIPHAQKQVVFFC